MCHLITIIHPFKGHHVAKGVGSLRQGADGDLALAGGVVSATAGLAGAAASCVDVGAIVSGAVEVVAGLRVGVGTACSHVERGQGHVLLGRRGRDLGVLEVKIAVRTRGKN